MAAGGGVVAAGGAVPFPPALLELFELFELFELLELFELFGGSFVVAALPLLSALGSVPSPALLVGTVGAEQPESAATPMLERASSERVTS